MKLRTNGQKHDGQMNNVNLEMHFLRLLSSLRCNIMKIYRSTLMSSFCESTVERERAWKRHMNNNIFPQTVSFLGRTEKGKNMRIWIYDYCVRRRVERHLWIKIFRWESERNLWFQTVSSAFNKWHLNPRK